jgi:anaerobic selenocysteine-containing dehydrogenase
MNLMPEQRASLDIDVALVAAGWILQNREDSNLAAGRGSYNQHNTVVYKQGDQYRGMPHRNTILMNRADIARAGWVAHQRVTVQGEAGTLQNVEIIPGEIRSGAALMFYPEVNAIIRAVIDSRSGTPAFKRVPVLVRAREDRLGPEG